MAKEIETLHGKKTSFQGICQKMLAEITSAYMFLMMAVYPLYYQNKYYNIGTAKWRFFTFCTSGAGVLLGAVLILYFLSLIPRRRPKNAAGKIPFSATDWFALLYGASALLSTLLSPYKEQVVWGREGWYMGLVSQLSFVWIYFLVSRCWRWSGWEILCWLGTAFLVFFLGVLMRFRVDPLGMYQGLEERYILDFLTTIGQATWYSSYLVLLLPLGVFAFWFYHHRLLRLFGGIFSWIGFMSLATQNSDSALAALCILLFALFWFSMENAEAFGRFLEVVLLCLASMRLAGLCQRLFPERAVPLGRLFLFCSQDASGWVLLAVALGGLLFFRRQEGRKPMDFTRYKKVPLGALFLLLWAVFCVVAYICLNTMGYLPDHLKSTNNYLLFDEYWGNNRGSTWAIGVKSYGKGSLLRKFFGCGPDGFSAYVGSFFKEELDRKWGRGTMLTCAHNEWLNTLVNLGITGAVTYMGIFLSAICRFFKKRKECPELIAVGISVMCYMGHNFFCYQQIVCTPTVFLLMGAGEALIRQGRSPCPGDPPLCQTGPSQLPPGL